MAQATARFHQARELFESWLDLPSEQRAARLAELAAHDAALATEVERLFSWDRHAEGFFAAGAGVTPSSPDSAPPPEITLYRLGELLGQGGMGSVYRGERTDGLYKKTVAVKILKASVADPLVAARFRAERQILAALEHPHIAKLLDGGTTTDGRPYYVMELIEGEPIDRWCDRHRLTLEARLELFLKVCGAVSFAHRHLVVHRDLKPGNILVTADGEPRLLDFGIAKLLEGEVLDLTVMPTEHGPAPLTPDYASPEQVSGKPVGAASDVYSLGVVLYRLLSGLKPYTLAGLRYDQLVAVICDHEPPRPSDTVALVVEGTTAPAERAAARGLEPKSLARRLRGDLDTLVGKALRKDPERRYPSVEQLADDLEAFLAGRPIRARPDTLGYRTAKFLSRHRWASAAAALALLTLLTLVGVLWRQRLDLLERQHQLLTERNLSRSVSGFLTEVFAMPDPARSRGREVTALELLDRGVEGIDQRLADQPEAKAELLLTMGRSYKSLGRYEPAERLFRQALELARQLEARPTVATALHELAEVASLAGRFVEAATLERESLAERARAGLPPDAAMVESLSRLGLVLDRTGRITEAQQAFEQALALGRDLGAEETLGTLLQRMASLERRRGRPDRAETMLREALALQNAKLGEDHPSAAQTADDLGLALLEQGQIEEAEQVLAASEAHRRRLYPQGHPDLATTLHNRALVAREQGRLEDAERLLAESIALNRRLYAQDDAYVAISLSTLAGLLQRTGRAAEAEARFREALAVQRRLLPAPHPQTAETLNDLAWLLLEAGRPDEAEPLFQEALEQTRATLGDEHSQCAVILNNFGSLALNRKDYFLARERFGAALAISRKQQVPRPQDLSLALYNLGSLAMLEHDLATAESRLGEALAVLLANLGEDDFKVAMVRLYLAEVLLERGERREAQLLARKAFDRLARSLSDKDPWVVSARRTLAKSQD